MMDWDKKYGEIAESLGLDKEKDLEATKILDGLIKNRNFASIEKKLRNKNVLVLGCGPSLVEDIRKLKSARVLDSFTVVAADGAAKALLENGIVPQINVTDLDGDEKAILKANARGTITAVHAHGDNILLLKKIVPLLKNPLGTTQTVETGKIKNFGGFTDGDRCVFLAVHFGAKLVVLAGMDFGEKIGDYSGTFDYDKKIKKLKIGKGLIEELVSENKTLILNVTSRGENIKHVPRISADGLRNLIF